MKAEIEILRSELKEELIMLREQKLRVTREGSDSLSQAFYDGCIGTVEHHLTVIDSLVSIPVHLLTEHQLN